MRGGGPSRALVIDPDGASQQSFSTLLTEAGFEPTPADSARAARYELSLHDFDLVFLDLHLPGNDSYALLEELRPRMPATVVIVVTASADAHVSVDALKRGACDCVFRPLDGDEVRDAVDRARRLRREELRRQATDDQLAWLVEERTRSLDDALHRLHDAQAAIKRIACSLAEIRDAETGGHLKRLAVYARELALGLPKDFRACHGIDQDYVALLVEAAPLHDIGKIGVPDQILLKRGPLTDGEREVMRQHSRAGERILRAAWSGTDTEATPLMQMGCDICRGHHERYDGVGYPDGLAGDAIPASARIIAVADVYDALATPRPYRPEALDHQVVRGMIEEERGRAFDPAVVDAFLAVDARMAQAARRIRDVEGTSRYEQTHSFGTETKMVAELLGLGA